MSDRPPEDSRRGDNTHIVSCEIYGGHRHYAVCLDVLSRVEKSANTVSERECQRAARCGECPSLAMRQEEKQAGKSLYYTPRSANPIYVDAISKRIDVLDPSYQRGWDRANDMILRQQGKRRSPVVAKPEIAAVKPAVRKPIAKPVATPASTGNLYADLINKMMAEREASK